MRVLICGDRDWDDKEIIRHYIPLLIDCVIEGGARGADTCARLVAEELGIPIIEFPAKWGEYGKAAGPIRNKQMLTEGKPDLVLAFHDDIENSKGTKNMMEQAKKAGIATLLYHH